ncbi:hypothetical protein R3P38DRAFT_2763565 [Favolaschia claudopus]|uniref:Uncharacterized protein n=1 Tax=Favolaschia claudopus TaxID=2862362 RepID=A0AAW0DFS8_9AGAR
MPPVQLDSFVARFLSQARCTLHLISGVLPASTIATITSATTAKRETWAYRGEGLYRMFLSVALLHTCGEELSTPHLLTVLRDFYMLDDVLRNIDRTLVPPSNSSHNNGEVSYLYSSLAIMDRARQQSFLDGLFQPVLAKLREVRDALTPAWLVPSTLDDDPALASSIRAHREHKRQRSVASHYPARPGSLHPDIYSTRRAVQRALERQRHARPSSYASRGSTHPQAMVLGYPSLRTTLGRATASLSASSSAEQPASVAASSSQSTNQKLERVDEEKEEGEIEEKEEGEIEEL